MDRVRVLFVPGVDTGNTNAQSLNVREIVLRLDPERFQSAVWYEHEPDPRLQNRSSIRLLKLPPHGKSRRIFKEMLAGYDIIAYIDFSPASYLFLHLPRTLRKRTKAVLHVEAPSAQLVAPSRTLRFLVEGIYPRCDTYTGITEFVARDIYKTAGKRASHILPVGVDTRMFTPPVKRANLLPVVLFAGTIMQRKGAQYVVDAAAQFPDAIFRLVGAGREGYEVFINDKIKRMALKNVRVDGPKTQSQMAAIMRESDVFLLPSRLEGIPKVTLEAAATGLPCIVFRDYETPSVIDGVTGFQVGTMDEMMQALGKLLADRSLRERMGAEARTHVEKFDWDVVGREWQTAYLRIAGADVN